MIHLEGMMLTGWKKYRMLMALLALFSAFSLGFAQFSSNVQGTVSDQNGAVLEGASVTLANAATGQKTTFKTNSTGGYRFDSVAPGDYEVTVEAVGFEKAVIARHVATQETAGVNIILTIGAVTNTVTVTSSQAGLNPDETRLQYTLETKDLTRIPLPDRSTISSLRVAPGVVGTIETNGTTNSNIPIGQPTPDARANGRPASSNLYLLDRIPITSTESAGALNFVPNPDMLAEIALQTTSFSVENGGTSSLQVDLTSKQGANQFHGDVDYTFSSRGFEARPYFGKNTPFHRKYLLGSLGGPIIKDHTFFFGSFEHVNNLSALSATGSAFGEGFYNWAKGAFPDSPIATKLLAHLPSNLSAQKVNNYARDFYPKTCGTPAAFNIPCDTPIDVTGQFNQAPGITGNQYNVRLDQSLRQDNDRAYVSFFRVDQMSDYLDPRPDFQTKTPNTGWFIGAGYSHIFSQNLTNQLNAGANRYASSSNPNPNYALFPHMTLFCFTCNGFKFFGGPQQSPDTPYISGGSKEHVYSLRDYVSWLKGRHSFRFGGQFQHIDYWQDNAANYSRPYNTWFSDLFEMLQGKADETALYTISARTGKWVGQYYGAQATQFGAYAEDEWKIRPNLLLSLGLRWDDLGNPSNYGAHAAPYSNTFLGAGSTLQEKVSNAYIKSVNTVFSGNQINNFLPRVGISWAPTADRKTTIRGGVGLYDDFIALTGITAQLPTTTPSRLTLTLHDNAEPFGGCFFCFFGGWHPWTGKSANPNLPDAGAFIGTQGNVAPYGIPYPNFSVTGFTPRGLATGQGADGSTFTYNSDSYGVDPKLKPQKTILWNLSVNQEGPRGVVFGVLYSGSRSSDLFLQSSGFDNPPGKGSNSYLWKDVGKINLITNSLKSNYNALIATVQQRTGNFGWQGSYTWGKTMDQGHWTNPYELQGIYTTSDLDVRNRFSFSGTYEFPGVGEKLVRIATKGWTVGSIAIAQSGTPFTINTSSPVMNDGQKDGNRDRPDVIPGTTHYGSFTKKEYVNGIFGKGGFDGTFVAPKATAVDPVTLEGNEPINAFRNPGYFDVDLNLQKRTQLPSFFDQKSTLIVRVEVMNALNHTNLAGPVTTQGDSQFGKSTAANNPRFIQLGARFEF